MLSWFRDAAKRQRGTGHVQERLENDSVSRNLDCSEGEPVTSTRTRFEEEKQTRDRDCSKTDANWLDFGFDSVSLLHRRDKGNGTRDGNRAGGRKRVSLAETCSRAPEVRGMDNEPDSDDSGARGALGTRRRSGKVATELGQGDGAGGPQRLAVERERASEIQRPPVECEGASGLAVGGATNDCVVRRVQAGDSWHRLELRWDHGNPASAPLAGWDAGEPLRKRPCSQQVNKQADMSLYTYNTNPPHASTVHNPPVVQPQIATLRGNSLDPLNVSFSKSSGSLESNKKVRKQDASSEDELPKCSKGVSNNKEDQCQSGSFEDGTLAGQSTSSDKEVTAPSGTSNKTIRGDKIMGWKVVFFMLLSKGRRSKWNRGDGAQIKDKRSADGGLGNADKKDALRDGQLAGQRAGYCKRHLRGDQITWVRGVKDRCYAIDFLLSLLDKLIILCGGKLENYNIKDRSQ
eukprot:g47202.t1